MEPTLTPLPTTDDELRAGLLEDANEAYAPPLPPTRPTPTTHCTVGSNSYSGLHRHTGDRRIPVPRLSGLWLEQLGFAIGGKLQIMARAGELVVCGGG